MIDKNKGASRTNKDAKAPEITMITDEQALFAPYLYEEDDLRPGLAEPFTRNGYVYASDTHTMLRVRQDLLKNEYPGHPKAPNAERVLPLHNFNELITLQQLEEAISQCPMEDEKIIVTPEVECDECDGDGNVDWEYHSSDGRTLHTYYYCPVCDGTGVKYEARYRLTGRRVPENYACVNIYGSSFNALYLLRLCGTMKMLGIESVKHVANHPGAPNTFNLTDGIELIIMPVLNAEPSATIE